MSSCRNRPIDGEGHDLTPRERDKLMIALAAVVARARLVRGLKAQLSRSVRAHHRFCSGGSTTASQLQNSGQKSGKILTRNQVMEGISEMIHRCKWKRRSRMGQTRQRSDPIR